MPRSQPRNEPERRCIVSGESRASDGLIRFVIGPDDTIVPDVDGRLPGRGIWVNADRDSIDAARRRQLFARAARQKVMVSETLSDDVEALLLARCLSRLGLARRSGDVVAGFEKVSDWLRRGGKRERGGLLLEARDGAADGKGKMIRLARALGEETGIVVEPLECFDAEELGRAVGMEQAVHVAVAAGGNADALRRDAIRLQGVRGIQEQAAANQCLQPEA